MRKRRLKYSISEIQKSLDEIYLGAIKLVESSYITKDDYCTATINNNIELKVRPSRLVNEKPTIDIILNGIKITYEKYVERLEKTGYPYKVKKDTYKNLTTKCTFIDPEYGEWQANPNIVLRQKTTHPKRGKEVSANSRKVSLTDIIKRIQDIHGETYKIDPSTYVNIKTKARFIDIKFGEHWATPDLVIHQKMQHPSRSCGNSKEQESVVDFLNSLNVKIEENAWLVCNGVRRQLDIYVPEYNLGIEYNGLYWHCEINRSNQHMFEKREFFDKLNINVIMINSDEWKFKRDICESIIKNKLKLNNKIYARKCILNLNPKKSEVYSFLNENHIMGEFKASKHITLEHNGQTVSALSYRKKGSGIEISRFCTKLNTSVIGGFSKIVKVFNSQQLISWVDLRYGTGESLLKTGFKLKRITLGWKWTDFTNTFNRLYCVAGDGFTERQNADKLKLKKIYDAGQALFERSVNV